MSDENKSASHVDRKPNRLIKEQSPYLRQHAYNPVDWYAWGPEALARAKAENKPILLSIGYSACHWCHVMERESFENEAIAKLMNDNFVSIKVDREERPDLDQIYMDAVQMITGRGGWPLTMFLAPDGRPFFGGTYYPPEDRQGMPGFPRLLLAVAQAYRDGAKEVVHNLEKLTQALGALTDYQPTGGDLKPGLPAEAARALATHYDSIHGGIGHAPKFPNTFVFSLFLRVYAGEGDESMAEMVRHTLRKMARGGMYDQIGGGFHRYSVDDRWLVPHFEKMLYDNALLSRLYLDAGGALNEPEFIGVASEILDYVLREMTSPGGGFYSSQDADSEGEEGKFFVWSVEEAEAILGPGLSDIAERYFDLSVEGNFEGANILHRTIEPADAARMFKISEDDLAAKLNQIREKLFAAREERVKPGRDDKILVAWNAMMIGGFAEGYRAVHDRRYLEAGERAADFIMTKMWDGRSLKRSYKDDVARHNAYLEDYAELASAMLDLYEASLNRKYLAQARTLAGVILERFIDREKGGFFFTSDDHEALITRSKAAFDGSTPSGNSAAVMALLRLHGYTGEKSYRVEAERTLKLFREFIEKQPFGFSHMLEAVDLYQRGPTEIVLVGGRDSAELQEWIERLGLIYVPNMALFIADPAGADGGFVPEQVRGKRQLDGRTTAYVCREHTCTAPIASFKELARELAD
ncbi:MAG: thioredoxin domain-containing protein [Candidatus Binatus sp.]|uniref:thioredoxin domain-containing protein n=1 Tax=Candidatus Binatus sp. TaxID=2811406 RepID=UPI00271F8F1C|nr:thioredoxin domain-containing protein [Candidatus Binatus sp.]MDO8431948.1 thioredoxin domain-containing protein [Candidatus Binatus sp.]